MVGSQGRGIARLLQTFMRIGAVLLLIPAGFVVLGAIPYLFSQAGPITPRTIVGALGLPLFLGVMLLAGWRILVCFRDVFGAIASGDPFQRANVGRLRLIGLLLVGMQAYPWAWKLMTDGIEGAMHVDANINFTALFLAAGVFALAEAFREGARLREDAELTV